MESFDETIISVDFQHKFRKDVIIENFDMPKILITRKLTISKTNIRRSEVRTELKEVNNDHLMVI